MSKIVVGNPFHFDNLGGAIHRSLALVDVQDIPTVSRWLGHKDGGALAMKVYGHLRDEHSAAQAQRVKFSN